MSINLKKKLLAMILAASTCLSSVASPCYADNYTNGTNISIAENFSDAESPLLALQGKVENCIHINSWLKYASYAIIFLFPFVGRKLGKPLGKYFANKKFEATLALLTTSLEDTISRVTSDTLSNFFNGVVSSIENNPSVSNSLKKILPALKNIWNKDSKALYRLQNSFKVSELTYLFKELFKTTHSKYQASLVEFLNGIFTLMYPKESLPNFGE